jgi:molybdate transport repressor ModE-like protein
MISLTQLRAFLAVAACGSVRAAAERLVVSQPAVSSALAALERELGAPVVERDGRGVRLTAGGTALVAYGRRIVALLDDAPAAVRAAAAAGDGRFRLAAVTTAAEGLLPEILSGFRLANAGIAVELDVANKDRVWDRLAHWEVDCVLAGRPPHGRAFRTLAVRANALVAVGLPGHPPGATELEAATWLLREPGSGTREATEQFFAELGIAPRVVTIGSNGAVRECIRAGLGISLLSRDAVARELAAGTLAEIPTALTPLVRDWHLVGSADRELTPSAGRFVNFAIASGAFRTAEVPGDDRGAGEWRGSRRPRG